MYSTQLSRQSHTLLYSCLIQFFIDHHNLFESTGTYTVVESDSDSYVIEVNDDSPDPVTSWWIKDLGLHESDRHAL